MKAQRNQRKLIKEMSETISRNCLFHSLTNDGATSVGQGLAKGGQIEDENVRDEDNRDDYEQKSLKDPPPCASYLLLVL